MSGRGRLALKSLLFLLGLGLFGFLVWQADPRVVGSQLAGFGWAAAWFFVPALVMYLLDALAWRFSFREAPPIPFPRLFLIRMAGESLNNSLPSAYLGGEPLKAYLLQREGVDPSEGVASVIVGKTAMTVAQALFVLAGVACAGLAKGASDSLPTLLVGSLVVALLFFGCMGLAYAGQRYGLGRLLRRFSEKTGMLAGFVADKGEALERLDRTLNDYYREDAFRFWISTGLFLLGWSSEVAEVAVFCHLIGFEAHVPTLIALGALATVVKASGFFLPASIGAQEGGNVLLFLAFGLTEAHAITFSILKRAREVLWIGFGLLGLALLGWPSKDAFQEPVPALE